MIKVTPKLAYYNQQNLGMSGMKVSGKFSPAQVSYSPVPMGLMAAQSQMQSQFLSFPQWVKDPTVLSALGYLNNLQFDENDVKYVQSIGAVLPFVSPKEALKFINDNNIRIKFMPLESSSVHAQYDFDNNFIEINKLYENTQNPAEILAIAEAILHETGHAKDKDSDSSVQEEIDCLAMNVLAHRVFTKKFPNIFSTADSLIVKDGVCVYRDLFFDKDPAKAALVARLREKYGYLPIGDVKHPPGTIATRVKNG